MRQVEIDEVAVSGFTPLEALKMSVAVTDNCQTVCTSAGDIPIAMFGTTPYSVKMGVVWLLTTNDIASHRIAFIRRSKAVIRELMRDYDILFNFVDARHTLSLSWLKYCGAIEKEIIEINGFPFHLMYFSKVVV